MRIVYHLGAHCTDEDRLVRCLLKNRATLATQGIIVPGPARYRTLLRDTAMQLRGQPASTDTQAMLLDQIMDEDQADRLVLAWENFMGYAQGAVRDRLYPAAGERLFAFAQVFPEIELEFTLGLRNPATFVPAMFLKQQGRGLDEFMAEVVPDRLRWSDTVAAIRAAVPSANVTVWCDEDTPLLWPEVLAAVSGHDADTVLEETGDLLAAIMQPDGMARMQAYMAENPPADALHRRRIVSAFLDKFARPEAIEMDLEMPGWTADLVERLTDGYDRDVARLMRMEGVTFLAP